MKISTMVAGIFTVLLAISTAQAQPTSRPVEVGGGFMLDRLRQIIADLHVSPEQQTKIDATLDKARTDMRDMIEELRQADPQTRRQRIQQFRSKLSEDISSILNSDQVKEFQEKIGELRQQAGGASTQPANRIAAMSQRLRAALDQIDLSDDQKTKVKQTLDDARQRLEDLRAEVQSDPTQAREKFQTITQDLRQQLRGILTPDQQQKLRSIMGPPNEESAAPPPQNAPPPPTTVPAEHSDASPPPSTAVQVGQKAPAFALRKLDGQTITLAALKGRLVLLIFGSYSSPVFRERAVDLEKFTREFSTHINPIVIYTRENYPKGQWEIDRNRDEGVLIDQPTSLDERILMAEQAHDKLHLSMPVAIDTMDDKTATDYGGQTNAAVLIGRDGTVLAYQKWFNPYTLRREIDDALKS
jgi:hypothetical protein